MMFSLEDSIKEVEKVIRRLEEFRPSDRLEAISNINECLESMRGMINGFALWIETPEFMNIFNKKETSDLLDSIRKVAIQLLKIGLKYARLASSNVRTDRDLKYLI